MEILKKYNVSKPEEIKAMIEKEEVGEHPAYEDYLDSVAYKMEIETLIKEIEARLHSIGSIS